EDEGHARDVPAAYRDALQKPPGRNVHEGETPRTNQSIEDDGTVHFDSPVSLVGAVARKVAFGNGGQDSHRNGAAQWAGEIGEFDASSESTRRLQLQKDIIWRSSANLDLRCRREVWLRSVRDRPQQQSSGPERPERHHSIGPGR